MKTMNKILLLSIAMFCISFLLVRPYQLQEQGLKYHGDDDSYLAHATSLVFFQFPHYEKESFVAGEKTPMHSIGAGLMASPFVFIFSMVDRTMNNPVVKTRINADMRRTWSLFGFVISTYFYFWLACVLLFLGLRYHVNENTAFLTVVFMIVAQGIPLYVFRRPILSNMYEFFLQSAFVYILLRNSKDNFLSQCRYFVPAIIGILCGLTVLVRHNNIILAAAWPLILYVGVNERRLIDTARLKKIFISYGIASLLGVVFMLLPLYTYREYGYSVVSEILFAHHGPLFFAQRLFHIFFGFDWGLMFTAPFAVLGLLGLLFTRHAAYRKILLALTPMLLNLLIVIVWGTQGGWYGYRYLTFILFPTVALPFAMLYSDLSERFGHKIMVASFTALSLVPFLSMVCFEGNQNNLTLAVGPSPFGTVGWINNSYQLEVWKTVFFHPAQAAAAIFKGGALYACYLAASLFGQTEILPAVVVEKYGSFDTATFVKMMMLYVFPFCMYLIHKVVFFKEDAK